MSTKVQLERGIDDENYGAYAQLVSHLIYSQIAMKLINGQQEQRRLKSSSQK